MSKFITVTDSDKTILSINVDHIVMVKKETSSPRAVIYFTPVNNGIYYCSVANESYDEVMALIRE